MTFLMDIAPGSRLFVASFKRVRMVLLRTGWTKCGIMLSQNSKFIKVGLAEAG